MKPKAHLLAGRRILIVEDDFLVAQVLVDLLEEAGAQIAGPIGSLDEAMRFLENDMQPLYAAVLDVNLHGRKSYPIADALTARRVAFVFATGYGGGILEEKYQRHPRCEKPFDQAALLAALARVEGRE
jgi:CheY-like chemotaxis protein